MKINCKIITNLKQINIKRTSVNLYKDIVLVTHLRIFCTTLFTNNNIKVVIQMHSLQFDPRENYIVHIDYYALSFDLIQWACEMLIEFLMIKKHKVHLWFLKE